MTPDLVVAYIDFFLGGDEKRVDMASIIEKRYPMCILFGGDGSYMSPYRLHNDILLTNLLGQVLRLILFVEMIPVYLLPSITSKRRRFLL